MLHTHPVKSLSHSPHFVHPPQTAPLSLCAAMEVKKVFSVQRNCSLWLQETWPPLPHQHAWPRPLEPVPVCPSMVCLWCLTTHSLPMATHGTWKLLKASFTSDALLVPSVWFVGFGSCSAIGLTRVLIVPGFDSGPALPSRTMPVLRELFFY